MICLVGMYVFRKDVDDAIRLTLLNSTGTRSVVHDVEVPRTDERSWGLRGPLVCDSGLDCMKDPVEQLYQRISADTVGVGKNDQIRQSDKTGSRDGDALHVDKRLGVEILSTTKLMWMDCSLGSGIHSRSSQTREGTLNQSSSLLCVRQDRTGQRQMEKLKGTIGH